MLIRTSLVIIMTKMMTIEIIFINVPYSHFLFSSKNIEHYYFLFILKGIFPRNWENSLFNLDPSPNIIPHGRSIWFGNNNSLLTVIHLSTCLFLENFIRIIIETQRKLLKSFCCLLSRNIFCSLGGFSKVWSYWCMHDGTRFQWNITHTFTLIHLAVSRSTVFLCCIIDRKAVRGRCFALQLNKSTLWINHQIKLYLQPRRCNQPYPATHSFSLQFLITSCISFNLMCKLFMFLTLISELFWQNKCFIVCNLIKLTVLSFNHVFYSWWSFRIMYHHVFNIKV